MSTDTIAIKMVVVGDGSVGKTCVLISYTTDKFPTDYVPTVFQNYAATVKVDNQNVSLGLWDTAGQQQYSKLRPLAYPGSDVFLITFSVIDPISFTNARKKWFKQVNEYNVSTLKIFIGNKIDLRDEARLKNKNKNNAPIETITARKIIQQQTGCKYFECSALTQQGLKQIFDEAMRGVLRAKGRGSAGIKKKDQECKLCKLI